MKKFFAFLFACLASSALAQDGPNHSMPVFGGPGFIGFRTAGPCAAGQALTWASSVVDPTCTGVQPTLTLPLPPSQGGTGLATLTNHGILVGQGTANLAFVGPCTIGFFVGGAGASADPTCQGFVASGTGALTRTWQAKSGDWVSVLDFAIGDCSTDDSTNIQNAINSLTRGGTVFFPPPSGGCYAIGSATTITLPSGIGIQLIGAGKGDSQTTAGTVLKATASITSVILRSAFARGDSIRDMLINCNGNAQYGLKLDIIHNALVDNVNIYDCTLRGIRLGGTGSSQENTISNIRVDNIIPTTLAGLPDYNVEISAAATNNNFLHWKLVNAELANLLSAGTANTYVGVHGYNFLSGGTPLQPPTNNFVLNGFGEQFYAWETDGSTVANVQIAGFAYYMTGGFSQFDSVTAFVGVNMANATCQNMIADNFFQHSTAANTVTQTGTPCAPGNFYRGNTNGTVGVLIGSRLTNTIAATLTAGCNGAGSSVVAGANKYYGKINGQTAAATTCTITFNGGGFTAAPVCTVSGQTVAATTVVPSTTTLVINFASTASAVWNYICDGNG